MMAAEEQETYICQLDKTCDRLGPSWDRLYHADDEKCGVRTSGHTCGRSGSRYDCPHHRRPGFCWMCGNQLCRHGCISGCRYKACSISNCDNNVYTDNEDRRVRGRCKFHQVCNIKGCSSTDLIGFFCVEHTCTREGCAKPLDHSGQTYCQNCQCAYFHCTKHTAGLSKDSVFCLDHECATPECHLLTAAGTMACEDHLCQHTSCKQPVKGVIWSGSLQTASTCVEHSCDYHNCLNVSGTGGGACAGHQCGERHCAETKLPGMSYCVSHICARPNCHRHIRIGTACFRHACISSHCFELASRGSKNCAAHKCAASRECQNTVEYGTTCRFHTCRCTGSSTKCRGEVHHRHCQNPQHICKRRDCRKAALAAGHWCEDHTCVFPECPAETGLKGTACSGHRCKSTSCLSPHLRAHIYCRLHACPFVSCRHENTSSGACIKHICRGCGKIAATGRCSDCDLLLINWPCTVCKKRVQHMISTTMEMASTTLSVRRSTLMEEAARYGTKCRQCGDSANNASSTRKPSCKPSHKPSR